MTNYMPDIACYNTEKHHPHPPPPSPHASHSFEQKIQQAHYHVLSELFTILDINSRGVIHKNQVKEFVYLRCPVFKRRDRALGLGLLGGRIGDGIQPVGDGDGDGDGGERNGSSTTFDEVWNAVVGCSTSINEEQEQSNQNKSSPPSLIGIEGWMVFSRFIALAQYQEAKRRFSSRHLQHTGVGDEVLINVPPMERPLSITVRELVVEYEMLVERNGGVGCGVARVGFGSSGDFNKGW